MLVLVGQRRVGLGVLGQRGIDERWLDAVGREEALHAHAEGALGGHVDDEAVRVGGLFIVALLGAVGGRRVGGGLVSGHRLHFNVGGGVGLGGVVLVVEVGSAGGRARRLPVSGASAIGDVTNNVIGHVCSSNVLFTRHTREIWWF